MTQLNTSHPYDFLLNYDTFTVFIPNGSQDLKRVPEILGQTVLSGKHSNMVKNLRVVHEALAWHENVRDTSEKNTFLVLNGAYHHAVWAIAHRLGREIPSSSAVQLCRLYYHNPYHAKAHDILHEEVREILKPDVLAKRFCRNQNRCEKTVDRSTFIYDMYTFRR